LPLRRFNWLWNVVRPIYRAGLNLFTNGLERHINGTDSILVIPELYVIGEEYEPNVWRSVMAEVKPGDHVVDVGAYVGLYTVALAKRVGTRGQVFAFEPDPGNRELLRRQCDLNGVGQSVDIRDCAVGDVDGVVAFSAGLSSESHVSQSFGGTTRAVRMNTLDAELRDARVDLMKIDVEGFECHVLRGARRLLGDPRRRPRAIFIEVHPFAWEAINTSSAELLAELSSAGYAVTHLDCSPVASIREYGEIVARHPARR
jgi:FkbM family methyltransferase